MKKLVLVPVGWPCSLEECPPGAFLFAEEHVGFKSEYRRSDGKPEAFNEAGEAYHGDGPVWSLKPTWEVA